MPSILSILRERAPRLWGVRLLHLVAMISLALAGVWQGEVHAHAEGSVAHVHAPAAHSHDAPDPGPQPDGSTPDALHLHDAAVTLVVLGPPAYSTELPVDSADWLPDLSAVRSPASTFTAPHRPPIA
jgi:hypothetical protein